MAHAPSSSRPLLVAVLPCPDPLTGGVQADLGIVEQLRRRGWDVETVYLEEAGSTPPRYRLRDQIRFNLRLIRRYRRAPRGFMLLEDQGISGAFVLFNLFAHLCKEARIAVITYHLVFNLWRNPLRRALRRAIEAPAVRSADLVIASSGYTREELRAIGVPEDRIRVVPLAVTRRAPALAADRAPSRDGGVRLVTVGTVEPRKGLQYLVTALGELRDCTWTLDVAGGDGGHRAALTELARELGIEPRVRFHGRVSDQAVADLMANADIYVSPSLGEGFGLAVLEAMEAGLPVIASSTGSLPELIDDGETGLLVPPADAPALVGALRRLLGDPELRRRLGRAAASHTRGRYTWEETGRLIDEALRELAARAPGR